MKQPFWNPERARVARALLLAPLIPLLLITLPDMPMGFIILIVGLPIAYACATLLGLPLYLLLKYFRLTDWSYFVIGGLLCSAPVIWLFYNDHVHYVYSLQRVITFAALGGLAAFIFWWITIKSAREDYDKPATSVPGYILLAALLIVGGYTYAMSDVAYTEGKLTKEPHPFVSGHDIWVAAVTETGEAIQARLPAGIPYRANCNVSLATWQDLFSRETVYSISFYNDSPFATHYPWLNDARKREITPTCP